MLKSEKKSLFRFLVIYMITTMALFTLAATWFYIYEKHRLLDLQREAIKNRQQTLSYSTCITALFRLCISRYRKTDRSRADK